MTTASPDPLCTTGTDTIVLSANGLRNAGSEAVLDVVLQHPPASCRLEITGRPVCAAGRELGIEAFVNGWWIGYWRVEGGDTVTLFADIEAEFLRPAPSGSFLRLAWRFTDWPLRPPWRSPGSSSSPRSSSGPTRKPPIPPRTSPIRTPVTTSPIQAFA